MKKPIWIVIVTLLLVGVVGFVLMLQSKQPAPNTPSTNSPTSSNTSADVQPKQNEFISGDVKLYFTVNGVSAHELHMVKNGVDTPLNISIPFDAPGGTLPTFRQVSPSVVLAKAGMGDMGAVWYGYYYVNIMTNKVTYVSADGHSITIEGRTMGLQFDDPCGYKDGKFVGTVSKLKGITVDGTLEYAFSKSYTFTCVDPGGIGSVTSPDSRVMYDGISDDMTHIYFSVIASNWTDGKESVVWKESLVYSIADNTVKAM